MAKSKVSSVCLCLNVQGFNPSPRSKSSWKLPRLKEEISKLYKEHFNVPFLAIVETWLKPEITEAEIHINGYEVFRCDREKTIHGGVLLYVHQKIIIDSSSYFNDDICCGVFCFSKRSKFVLACVYRPPTADFSSFSKLLEHLNNFILQYNPLNKYHVFVFGDFNLPKFCWKSFNQGTFSCQTPPYKALVDFMNHHYLSQYVEENTRKDNILDLFLTDDACFVHHVTCNIM